MRRGNWTNDPEQIHRSGCNNRKKMPPAKLVQVLNMDIQIVDSLINSPVENHLLESVEPIS